VKLAGTSSAGSVPEDVRAATLTTTVVVLAVVRDLVVGAVLVIAKIHPRLCSKKVIGTAPSVKVTTSLAVQTATSVVKTVLVEVVAVANQDLVPDLAKVAGIALGRVPGIVDVVALVAAVVAHVLEIETENVVDAAEAEVVDAAEAEVVDAAEAEVEAIARRNPKRPLSLAAAARAKVSLALPQKSRKKNSLKPLRRLEADFS